LNVFRNCIPKLERAQLQNAIAGNASDNTQVTGSDEFSAPHGLAASQLHLPAGEPAGGLQRSARVFNGEVAVRVDRCTDQGMAA
jgi:hypothetical protein